MKTTSVSKKDLKNQILNEAVKVLGESGFEGLSLREVAKKLKVTHQAPYHYFAGKNALVLELKNQGFEMLNRGLAQVRDDSKNNTAIETLQKIAMFYFDFCLENPGYFRAMYTTQLGEPSRTDGAAQSFNFLRVAIVNIQGEGFIPNRSAEVMAMICWTYMHGLVTLALDKYPVLGGVYKTRILAEQMAHEMSQLLRQSH